MFTLKETKNKMKNIDGLIILIKSIGDATNGITITNNINMCIKKFIFFEIIENIYLYNCPNKRLNIIKPKGK